MSALLHDATATLSAWQAPDAAQDALRTQYLAHLAAHDDAALWREGHADHLTGSVVILSADLSHVLLTLHKRVGRWLQMGGHCERDDVTLADVARREGLEESGVAGLVLDPVPVELDTHDVPFCGDRPDAHHLDVRYVATAPAGARPVVSEESDDVRWFALDALPDLDASVSSVLAAGVRRLRESPAPAR